MSGQLPDTKKNSVLRGLVLGALLFCSLIAIMIDPSAYDPDLDIGYGFIKIITLLRRELGPVGPAHVIAACTLTYLYFKNLLTKDHPFDLAAFIVGLAISTLRLIGMSFSADHSFTFILDRHSQTAVALLTWMGCLAIAYTAFKLLYEYLDRLTPGIQDVRGSMRFIGDHLFIISCTVMLAGWLILGFGYLPGSVPHDGRNQLSMYFGVFDMNLHHPYFSTMLMGTVYRIGKGLAGPDAGCFACVMFQSLCGAVIFSRIICYIRKKCTDLRPALGCLAFFTLAPMWWTYMGAVIKDTMFFIVFAWFAYEYVRIILGDETKYIYVRLFIAALSACLLRNGSIMIVLPALLAMLPVTRGKKLKAAITLIMVFAANFLLSSVLMNAMNLRSDNQVEMYSIPIQQIARYVKYHEDELTQEEKDVIDHIVEYKDIGDRYDPNVSDPVKNIYRDSDEEDWDAFWRLWADKLKKDPLLYAESVLNNVFGYTDPFYFYYGMSAYQNYNKKTLGGADSEDIIYSDYIFPETLRQAAADGAYTWNKVPLLSFVVNPAFYTCLGMVLIGGVVRKKAFGLLPVYVAPFMTVLVCFASPVNGLVRYMLPVMAAMPLFVLTGMQPYLKKQEDETGE